MDLKKIAILSLVVLFAGVGCTPGEPPPKQVKLEVMGWIHKQPVAKLNGVSAGIVQNWAIVRDVIVKGTRVEGSQAVVRTDVTFRAMQDFRSTSFMAGLLGNYLHKTTRARGQEFVEEISWSYVREGSHWKLDGLR